MNLKYFKKNDCVKNIFCSGYGVNNDHAGPFLRILNLKATENLIVQEKANKQ